MSKRFNASRLELARKRRGLTITALAKLVNLTPRMVSEYERENCIYAPQEQTINAFVNALRYPVSFFFGDDIEKISPETVSFRSMKKMRASQQHAAIGAGQLGILLNNYFESRFELPNNTLPDLREIEPETAAETIRDNWGIGQKSISNMVHLLEVNGVRVFSLSENAVEVDAFSFWKEKTPYIFLNNKKTGERSRFDAAHELGHLVLHKHGSPQGKDIESEADRFASAFLMPKRSIIASKMRFPSLDGILSLKGKWKVSAMALIVRMKSIGLLSEWQYRMLVVDASKAGLRVKEINGIEREKSLIIETIIGKLKEEGVTLPILSRQLNIPLDEILNLIFRFSVIDGDEINTPKNIRPSKLRLVYSKD